MGIIAWTQAGAVTSSSSIADGSVEVADLSFDPATQAELDAHSHAAYAAKASNLSDLASATTARTNLGLGTAALISSTAGGDLTGTLPSPTLAAIGSATGPSGSATVVPVVTIDTKGRVTALTTASIAIPESAVTSLVSDLAAKAAIQETVVAGGNTGTAKTIADVTTGTVHTYTMTGNCTFTFPAAGAGKSFTLELTQDGTGSRLATWPGTVKWPAATAPTLATVAAHVDLLVFTCIDGTNWRGVLAAANYSS